MEQLGGRRMPFSAEAEQSVLGSVLIDPEKLTDITNIVHAEDFYLREHAQIFSAMQKLFLQSRMIDTVTLIDMLVKDGVYDEDSSKNYIKLIIETVATAENIVDYATIVREKSMLRKLIAASEQITQTAYSEQGNVSTILDDAEQKIFAIAQSSIMRDFVPINEVLGETYQYLQDLQNSGGKTVGVRTGFSALDRVLVNLGPGDRVLVGARPGMGNTTFAMNVATNIARHSGKAVCVFSLEMSARQLVLRMISSEALVDSYKLRSGELGGDDWGRIAETVKVLADCEIFIDDTTNITVTNMKAKLRRIKNLGFVVIDYLQLMKGESHTENRVNEVGDISRNLKIMAKELGIPVMVCAQLSRASEKRDDKRPMLSDLRDSGAIEQDADMVLFLYRDEYYSNADDALSTAEVIVAKNRHGSLERVKMGFQGQFTRFTTLDRDHE